MGLGPAPGVNPGVKMAIDTGCALCSPRRPCEFHAATDVRSLGKAVLRSLKKKGAIALARFLTSAIAGIERGLPPQVLDTIGDLEVEELEQYVQAKLASKRTQSSRDLRELAGCFIALAMLADADDAEDDDDESEEE